MRGSYALLEGIQVVLGESIRLRNDGDQVDTGAQTLHDLDVQGLETVSSLSREPTGRTQHHSRVTSGTDKVQASMNTKVTLVDSLGLLFLTHVGLMLVVDKVDDGYP